MQKVARKTLRTEMNELTEQFLRYREIARFIWNTEFRFHPDGEHEFYEIDDMLFQSIVVSSARNPKADRDERLLRYSFIKVEPQTSAPQVAVLEANEQEDRVVWRQSSVSTQRDLRYVAVFDFDTLAGQYRDFRFLEVVDNASTNCRFLLDASIVHLVDLSS